MFLEIIPDAYDVTGHKSYQPHLKKGIPPPTFPFGRYVSKPPTIHCKNLQEVRDFLRSCRQMSDENAFGKKDYWLPPDEFEKLKKGDCDDFALWTWRQLQQMGYPARFVAGEFGRYSAGHAWVTFEKDAKHYIADATRSSLGIRLPRLQVFKYRPIYSVEWNGSNIVFYSHRKQELQLRLARILRLIPEIFFYRGHSNRWL